MTGLPMILACVALAIVAEAVLFYVDDRRRQKRQRELEILRELHRRVPTRGR